MKNILFTTIFTLLYFSGKAKFSENINYGKISFERVLNFDGNLETTEFDLFFSPNFSVFSEKTAQQKKSSTLKPSTDDEFDLSFDVKFNGSKYVVLTDFKRDSIYSQVSLFKNGKQTTYIVCEKAKKIKWEITQEFKMISGFKAQKATCLFRGRNYSAWFTKKIPIKYGPWKLNGLPGLILNVSDDKNEVAFNVTKIEIPNIKNTKSNNYFEFNKTFKKISLKEYIKLKKGQVEEVMKLFGAKLPRGSNMKISTVKSKAIELEYENTVEN
ncbi:GLPGLI family protein [Polaribacter porphyrae]|uniref:GLPGLI family protein n=1 Tax=Polaribacter porphyrae TaxID=1137780 RepID=A0A2S7WPD6_9FLAO|nr:GLPGLI family protein [Polaribacter porphyrae]PQJ79475.1 hypothetical protein BTO18_09960 [Polaribacter porphyrae]